MLANLISWMLSGEFELDRLYLREKIALIVLQSQHVSPRPEADLNTRLQRWQSSMVSTFDLEKKMSALNGHILRERKDRDYLLNRLHEIFNTIGRGSVRGSPSVSITLTIADSVLRCRQPLPNPENILADLKAHSAEHSLSHSGLISHRLQHLYQVRTQGDCGDGCHLRLV